jgi:hypothetical protein
MTLDQLMKHHLTVVKQLREQSGTRDPDESHARIIAEFKRRRERLCGR